jgi:tetratricopeptide (TPR) repeat protein
MGLFVRMLAYCPSASGRSTVPHPSHIPFGPGPLVLLLVTALLGPLIGGAAPVHAQVQDSTELKRFRRADSYLQGGQFEDAIRILESLYEQSPNNSSFYRKLKDAYESVKRYDDALRLVEDRLSQRRTPHLLSEKARLLYEQGNEAAADSTWATAINRAPGRTTTYRIVYQTLVDIRRFKQAIEVLQQARDRLDDPSLFRLELAYLYGLDGQHRKAMREYVTLLENSPRQFSIVRGRLQSFVEQDEGIQSSIDVLTTAVEQNPLSTVFRDLLAWLYVSTNRYEAAYDVYRALDRLQQKNGKKLYEFARKATDADQFSIATTAFEDILKKYPDATIAPSVQKALGDTYRRWAEAGPDASPVSDSSHYAAARSAYETFLENYPSHKAVPTVLSQLGTLQLDVYRNLDAAQSTLKKVVSSSPKTEAANEARYDLGRIALLRGDLERARLLFSRLAERLRSGDLADRARFELALLQFYQGRFGAAQVQAKATSANTSSDVTNDAIELRVLIQQNKGPDSLNTPLRTYARARLALRQHDYEAAGARLDSLLQSHKRHALADDAHFRRAEVSLAQGDTSRARQQYETLPKQHPRSPYADRSLFRLGELYEAQGKTDRAVTLYDRLLTQYPNSLLAADARTRLRTLRRSRS